MPRQILPFVLITLVAEASPTPPLLEECQIDADCDNGVWCTLDTCVDNFCQHSDLCADDGLFCNGAEVCCVTPGVCWDPDDLGDCGHTGPPCPFGCDEENEICLPLDALTAEPVGSRYIAVSLNPSLGDLPVGIRVTSPDWPCLDKYVGGFLECGDTSTLCFTDADCNECIGGPYNGPCLTDEDCKTCAVNYFPCQTDEDCSPWDTTCVQVQTCDISGHTCAPAVPLKAIDLNYDGLDDGLVASLVDEEDALWLTRKEWGSVLYQRCSISFSECDTDSNCDVGTCSISGNTCSCAVQDCRNTCTLSGYECDVDEHCIQGPEDTCTVPQTCELYETCMPGKVYVTGADIMPSEESYSTTYGVQAYSAEYGPLGEIKYVTMMRWADALGNYLVNFADVQIAVLGFKRKYFTAIPPRTVVASDLVGAVPCVPDQGISFDDIQLAVLAFLNHSYNPDTLDASVVCDVPCP